MWPASLRASERGAWLNALATDCEQRFRVVVTDRSWNVIGSTTVRPSSLQATIDTSGDTDRRLDITGIESGDLLEQSSRRLWHTEVLHRVPDIGWVSSPLGVYVPNRVTRRGPEITASLPDLEAMWAVALPRNQFGAIDKGVPPIKAARDLLFALGVRRFRFPVRQMRESNGKGGTQLVKTTRRWAYGGENPDDRPIQVIKKMLASHGWQFFFDGDGIAVVRDLDHRPVYDLDRWLLDLPEETTEWGKAYNRVLVKSGDGKKAMYGRASLPNWHPASADKRAVNGVDIVHTLHLDSESRKKAVLDAIAAKRIRQQVDAAREVRASAIPLPLDPLDRVRVTTPSGPITAALRQASFDWSSDVGMEVGIARSLPARRPRRRTRSRR